MFPLLVVQEVHLFLSALLYIRIIFTYRTYLNLYITRNLITYFWLRTYLGKKSRTAPRKTGARTFTYSSRVSPRIEYIFKPKLSVISDLPIEFLYEAAVAFLACVRRLIASFLKSLPPGNLMLPLPSHNSSKSFNLNF